MASGHETGPHQKAEHMAAPTSTATSFKKTLANTEPSTHALANKIARIAWAMMSRNETYQPSLLTPK